MDCRVIKLKTTICQVRWHVASTLNETSRSINDTIHGWWKWRQSVNLLNCSPAAADRRFVWFYFRSVSRLMASHMIASMPAAKLRTAVPFHCIRTPRRELTELGRVRICLGDIGRAFCPFLCSVNSWCLAATCGASHHHATVAADTI